MIWGSVMLKNCCWFVVLFIWVDLYKEGEIFWIVVKRIVIVILKFF